MTLKSNRAPLLYHIKLCASFQSHCWIQIGDTVWKSPIWVKRGNFFVPCDLEIWWMTLKKIGHLFYTRLSYVHHPKAIGEIKLGLPSGNAQFGSKFFCPVWPWSLMDDLEKQKNTSSMLLQALCIIWNALVNSNWSYSPETTNLGLNWRFFELCDLEIWQMTLKNIRAPLLSNIKPCASFHHHKWI